MRCTSIITAGRLANANVDWMMSSDRVCKCGAESPNWCICEQAPPVEDVWEMYTEMRDARG